MTADLAFLEHADVSGPRYLPTEDQAPRQVHPKETPVATSYFTVSDDHLEDSDSTTLNEGDKVIRVVLPNGDDHIIGPNARCNATAGALLIYSGIPKMNQITLRTYGAWLYVETVPYKDSGLNIW